MSENRYRIARKLAKKTQQEAADVLGTSLDTIWRLESGKRKPKVEEVQKLAVLYNVTRDYLLGETDTQQPSPAFTAILNDYIADENEARPRDVVAELAQRSNIPREMIERYTRGEEPSGGHTHILMQAMGYEGRDGQKATRKLKMKNKSAQGITLPLATQKRDDGMDLSAILPTDNLIWIPVIRPEITLEAGYGADYTYSQLEWETVERIPLFDGELSAFYSEDSLLAMRVEGDSMEPQIHDGDLAVFAKTQDWVSGNIMAVCLDGKLLVKGIISNGANKPPTLRSTNKAYDDIKISPDSYFAIIGRVVRIVRVTKPKPVI